MDVDSLNFNSTSPEVDPEGQMQIRYKPEETAITLAAKKTYLGRVYLSWAQYPLTETEELASDPVANGRAAYAVRFRDLRYDYPGRDARDTLGGVVLLTRDLQVVEERFGLGSLGNEISLATCLPEHSLALRDERATMHFSLFSRPPALTAGIGSRNNPN